MIRRQKQSAKKMVNQKQTWIVKLEWSGCFFSASKLDATHSVIFVLADGVTYQSYRLHYHSQNITERWQHRQTSWQTYWIYYKAQEVVGLRPSDDNALSKNE